MGLFRQGSSSDYSRVKTKDSGDMEEGEGRKGSEEELVVVS